MKATRFDTEYTHLNSAQKEAVDTIEGPVMVVAGPGTGKTQILTLRIANILKRTDVPPDAILALTFTDNATGEMKRRLVDIVGPAGYRVNVHTFHGFANEIIGKFPNYFTRLVGATNIGEVERAAILEEIFKSAKLDKLRPYGDPFYYLAGVRGRISNQKREGISPTEYLAQVAKEEEEILGAEDLYHTKGAHKGKMKGKYADALERIVRLKEFALVYKRYEELLAERRLYDYDDMILEVVRTMQENEDFRLRLSEEYQYILADEHQDANGAQNKLLELLASFFEEPNLFLVGDEKQAIFRFQGASLENFRNFKTKYKSAKVIVLENNYRSGQAILDVASSLIADNKLVASKEGKAHVHQVSFADREHELLWLAKEDLTNSAILVRDNADAYMVAETLGRADVPYILLTDDDLFANNFVRELVAYLRAIQNLGHDDVLVPALHAPSLNLDPLAVYRLIYKASKDKVALYDALKHSEFANVYKLLASWRSYEKVHGALALIEKVCEESGLLGRALVCADPETALHALSGFLDYAKQALTRSGKIELGALIAHIDLSERYNIKHKSARATRDNTGVRIMTAHKSKGLEFDKVYVVFVEDGRWGGRKNREMLLLPSEQASNELEDERRLFYVALTRARFELTISYSLRVGDKNVMPSQFIAELNPDLFTSNSHGSEPTIQEIVANTLVARVEPVFNLSDQEFVRERLREQGLSVSALNNYLECPWKYFYQSLIRVPRTPDKFAMFGTAVHLALHVLNESARESELISEQDFINAFEQEMVRSPLPKLDIDISVVKGKKALSAYYKTYLENVNKNILSEFDIKGIHLDILDLDNKEGTKNIGDKKFEPVLLRGRIDKMEIIGDGVNVVDYKTGKPKSRNVLMGKTHNSTGNEYRQLLFYKILLDRYKGGMYKVLSGEIDFIEPSESGKHKNEIFDIPDDEVRALESKILEVATEIRDLVFWNKTCKDKKCEYCKLRNMMKYESLASAKA